MPDPEFHSAASADAWQPTLQVAGPPTQIFGEHEQAATEAGVGRRIGDRLWELFVVFDPAQALQQQFDQRADAFVALHDIGSPVSRRWLGEFAAARALPLHRLVIRSQGYGVALATLEFVELPTTAAAPVRLYATDVDADTRQRQQLARVLLGASRLGVVLVGDLPPHALAAALRPLHDAIVAGPWRNRELLMLPLTASGALAQQAAQLGLGRGIHATVATPVTNAHDAIAHVVATWNRLHQPLGGGAAAAPTIRLGAAASALASHTAAPPPVDQAPAATPARPLLPLQPMPDPRAAARSAVDATPLQRYVRRCLDVKGMVSCCVFEVESQRTLGFAGARPGPAALATQGAAMFAALAAGAQALGLGAAPPETALTLAGHYLVLRPLPGHAGVLLHAVIDRSATPLVLALRHLERLDETLGEG